MDWITLCALGLFTYSVVFVILVFVCLRRMKDRLLGQQQEEVDVNGERMEEAKQNAERRNDIECVVCLDAMGNKKVVALCSHVACASCFV